MFPSKRQGFAPKAQAMIQISDMKESSLMRVNSVVRVIINLKYPTVTIENKYGLLLIAYYDGTPYKQPRNQRIMNYCIPHYLLSSLILPSSLTCYRITYYLRL
jgi:hypothetical protein